MWPIQILKFFDWPNVFKNSLLKSLILTHSNWFNFNKYWPMLRDGDRGHPGGGHSLGRGQNSLLLNTGRRGGAPLGIWISFVNIFSIFTSFEHPLVNFIFVANYVTALRHVTSSVNIAGMVTSVNHYYHTLSLYPWVIILFYDPLLQFVNSSKYSINYTRWSGSISL